MPPYENPTVLITRPRAAAEAFCAQLKGRAGEFAPVISPAFEIVSVAGQIPAFEAAIFTSKAGVAVAPDGGRRLAWCVGRATAEAAQAKGYEAVSADGNANDLVEMILAARPALTLLHIRGENSRGNVRDRLKNAGLDCLEHIAYRKDERAPVDEARALSGRGQNLIIPLFSGETVSILAGWGLDLSGCHVVAISDEVAREAEVLRPAHVTISDRPDVVSLAQAVAGLIA